MRQLRTSRALRLMEIRTQLRYVRLLAAGRLFLDDADSDVRAVLGYLPGGAQPPAQIGGKAPQDGVAGHGRWRRGGQVERGSARRTGSMLVRR